MDRPPLDRVVSGREVEAVAAFSCSGFPLHLLSSSVPSRLPLVRHPAPRTALPLLRGPFPGDVMNRPLYGTLACVGDSLTYPARLVRGFPEVLAGLATDSGDGTTWLALNRGVCGETSWQILQRLPAVLRELTGYPGAHLLTLLAGTNDLKEGIPTQETLANLREMLSWCDRSPQVGVLLGGLPPLCPQNMPSFWRVTEEKRLDLNRQMEALARARGVRFVSLEDTPLCGDGVHLSEAGAAFVARAFYRAAFSENR